MYDLHTIRKLNAKATAEHEAKTTASTKWAVKQYTGLALVGVTNFDTEEQAKAFASPADITTSAHCTIVPPTV